MDGLGPHWEFRSKIDISKPYPNHIQTISKQYPNHIQSISTISTHYAPDDDKTLHSRPAPCWTCSLAYCAKTGAQKRPTGETRIWRKKNVDFTSEFVASCKDCELQTLNEIKIKQDKTSTLIVFLLLWFQVVSAVAATEKEEMMVGSNRDAAGWSAWVSPESCRLSSAWFSGLLTPQNPVFHRFPIFNLQIGFLLGSLSQSRFWKWRWSKTRSVSEVHFLTQKIESLLSAGAATSVKGCCHLHGKPSACASWPRNARTMAWSRRWNTGHAPSAVERK